MTDDERPFTRVSILLTHPIHMIHPVRLMVSTAAPMAAGPAGKRSFALLHDDSWSDTPVSAKLESDTASRPSTVQNTGSWTAKADPFHG
jgi:hypothetical protein